MHFTNEKNRFNHKLFPETLDQMVEQVNNVGLIDYFEESAKPVRYLIYVLGGNSGSFWPFIVIAFPAYFELLFRTNKPRCIPSNSGK